MALSLVANTRARLATKTNSPARRLQRDCPPATRCPVMTAQMPTNTLGCAALHPAVTSGRDRYLTAEEKKMSIWTILFVVLLIAWLGGFTVFHVAGGLIHLLLVFAVISLILHFVMGSRTA